MWSIATAKSLSLVEAPTEIGTAFVFNPEDVAPTDIESHIECHRWLSERGISANKVVGVLCETDTGLRTAEVLASTLQLATMNVVNEARRDKFQMMETLRKRGLAHIPQVCSEVIMEPF